MGKNGLVSTENLTFKTYSVQSPKIKKIPNLNYQIFFFSLLIVNI